jgi:hypothetical protein
MVRTYQGGRRSCPREATVPEIITKPKEAEVLLGQGRAVSEMAKTLGTSEVTRYRWREEEEQWEKTRPVSLMC